MDDLDTQRSGYERFFSESSDGEVVSVRRREQITTLVGKSSNQNKIKISLSQEQIVNGLVPGSIKRSQSINIQRTFYTPSMTKKITRGQSVEFNSRNSLRPSMIPVKVNDSSRMCSSLVVPSRSFGRRDTRLNASDSEMSDVDQSKIRRKFSIPATSSCHLTTVDSNNRQTATSLPYIRSEGDGARSLDTVEIESQFKCSFCRNMMKDPRVLDCLHTFCLECLYEIESMNKGKGNRETLPSVVLDSENREFLKIAFVTNFT